MTFNAYFHLELYHAFNSVQDNIQHDKYLVDSGTNWQQYKRSIGFKRYAHLWIDQDYLHWSYASIIHHNTHVVTWPIGYNASNNPYDVILDHGGWKTSTTLTTINHFCPIGVHVFQKNWDWFVHLHKENLIIPFISGFSIRAMIREVHRQSAHNDLITEYRWYNQRNILYQSPLWINYRLPKFSAYTGQISLGKQTLHSAEGYALKNELYSHVGHAFLFVHRNYLSDGKWWIVTFQEYDKQALGTAWHGYRVGGTFRTRKQALQFAAYVSDIAHGVYLPEISNETLLKMKTFLQEISR